MPVTFTAETQAVVPPELSRAQVIKQIQKHEPIVREQPIVDHFERLYPDKVDHLLEDSFFAKDGGGTDIATYEIHERVPIISFLGISKVIKFPVYYQNFANGVRARVDAPGGTTLRIAYTVRPLNHDAELRRGAWRLVEESQVQCNMLLKPFIMKNFEAAHRNICQRVIDRLSAVGNAEETAG